MTARLIHLNGPAGVGKSTLARRYVEEHPGVLDCDVDVLRTLIGGWERDFLGAGRLVRPAALAFIEAYLRESGDVVLPQLLVRESELARFEGAARGAGAEFLEVVILDAADDPVGRFRRRGAGSADPWHEQVRRIVDAEGGDDVLAAQHDALVGVLRDRPAAAVVRSVEGDVDGTYERLLDVLDGPRVRP